MNLLENISKYDETVKKKYTLKGKSSNFQAYRIPLNNLKYNVKNDRIATFISQYLDEQGDLPKETEELNNILEGYIEKSNPNSFKKTKANINIMGQQEIAVVMSDGVVIDGNRRFTALRQLAREGAGSEFSYLEAVILNRSKYEDKDIKRLELNLQHAMESKVDYNPIERLVGIYNDLLKEGHEFTLEEYATETQTSLNKLKEEVEIAKLLVDYLKFINQPSKFHIARTQNIDGPLREAYKILKSNKIDEELIDDAKDLLFANITSLDGDVTRKIRELKMVFEDKDMLTAILDETDDSLDDIEDSFHDETTEMKIRETAIVEIPQQIKQVFTEVTEKYVEKKKITIAKNAPVVSIKKALERIRDVDNGSVYRLNADAKKEFANYLKEIIIEVKKFEDVIDVN